MMQRKPDFSNLLKVLNRKVPDRPTLFEMFLNDPLYAKLAGYSKDSIPSHSHSMEYYKMVIRAYAAAGYDYATVLGSEFHFPKHIVNIGKTHSLNESNMITDRESFQNYPWPDPDSFDYSILEKLKKHLPDKMKLIVRGKGGVLENVIDIVGYNNLCFMIYDNPNLVGDIFEQVGRRFVKYYEICAQFDSVGALISNDDWGFNTQTLLSHDDLRQYVFPWHKKIADVIHKSGKPAILHSCGNLTDIMDDVIDYMRYDAKHSYEDSIIPVEEAYVKWGDRIAILGGIDLDFVCRETPEKIQKRCIDILKLSMKNGGYALGTGNSIPKYVPDENYYAMIESVHIT